MSSVPPARCARHDLAPGPDGRCVLCRRELQGTAAIEIPAEPSGLPGWVLSVVIAALVIGVAAFTLRDSAPQPSAAAPAAIQAPPRVREEPEKPKVQQPKERTVEEQLADAEREREERERELAEQQRAEVRRRMEAAEAKRKAAEQASDKKRHAMVTRELENAGLANLRRRVNITMYSTSWCRACKQARAYMLEQNIQFTDYDVEHDTGARAQAVKLNPRGSVPTISIDGDVLIGFSPKSLETRIDNAAKRRKGS